MSDAHLDKILEIIQEDVGQRGLRRDPNDNLITACPHDFHDACRSLADAPKLVVGILTGFLIPHAEPPCGETDGPLGALYLARTLVSLGGRAALVTDAFCKQPLEVGRTSCNLSEAEVPILTLRPGLQSCETSFEFGWCEDSLRRFGLTHLIALERVGPSHTAESLWRQPATIPEVAGRFMQDVPAEHHDRCHNMRGRDITANMAPAHQLVESLSKRGITTIGIGDGGNEIGMGKIPWDTIRRNIPGGGVIACRVPTDYLIVAGVSNWGAYGLAAGVSLLKTGSINPKLVDPTRERELLQIMVERGPLVDGVTGKPTMTVDALDFERYIEPLVKIRELCAPGG